ncbi:large subunit ribosomal protein L6e [Nematocida homosporus]|uniref:large subunit ribosomal protein L6e n=1 Tax=Nematocida homosporus TaxID=1912981 RepID=UPI0022209D6C|nr:large subunit ribosomal protein L6e [Nematocida homosporus]KAI5187067.1 large subunit ribosomal protein L6e [Nematocida homosporus]
MIRNIRINVQQGDKYPAEDVPTKVLTWLARNKRHVDPVRKDLIEGQVVVILEGQYIARRAVLVKRLPRNLILVAGVPELNGVPLTVLNQRYVLPVSVFMPLSAELRKGVTVQKEGFMALKDWTVENAYDLEVLDLIKTEGVLAGVAAVVAEECAKTKGLKTYFKTPFKLPQGVDPLSVFY